MKNIIGFIFLWLWAAIAIAQGPVVPCTDCADHTFTSPESGLWFNPDEPGSGFSVDMQNGLLLGGFYSYTSEGDAQWYIFSGRLEPDEGNPTMLTMVVPLQRFELGACPNCGFVPPQLVDDVNVIEIGFTQRNYGYFRINGNDQKNIVPLFAALGMLNPFPEVSDYAIPEMTGTWALALDDLSIFRPWGRSSVTVEFGDFEVLRDAGGRSIGFRYPIRQYLDEPEIVEFGALECFAGFDVADKRLPPACRLLLEARFPFSTATGIDFVIPPAGISDARFDATNLELGLRLYAFRVDYE